MKTKLFFLLFLSLVIFSENGFSQEKNNILFFESELMVGSIVPNFPNFPKTGVNKGFSLAFGKEKKGEEHWTNYYNKPSYGIALSYTESANVKEFGREYGVLTFLELSPNKKSEKVWFFRMGIGTSYFSNHYKPVVNERNKVIGSHWNWRFRAFLNRHLTTINQINLRLGTGFIHSSNGHTQLPNYGMNAAMLSLSARYSLKQKPTNQSTKPEKKQYTKKERKAFIQKRFGIGMHEYGGTIEPIGGTKEAVYSSSMAYGLIFNQQLKVRTGFTYRYYLQYYHEIKKTENRYSDQPHANASNLYWLLGIEYLVGNFAIDVEGGINLFKPYYKQHFKDYERDIPIHKFLKSTFPMRMGLNAYLFKPSKNKKYNPFLGASINANFGQADFSQLNFGLMRKFN